MEEDIKILERLIEEGFSVMCPLEAQAVENLIKGYRELEERNKELYGTCCRYEDTLEHYEYKIFDELDDYIKLDEISKLDKIRIKGKKYFSESKIKEKIEELEEEIKPKQDIHQKLCIEVNKIGTETEYDYAMEELSILDDELREMLIKKRVLQELLGDE